MIALIQIKLGKLLTEIICPFCLSILISDIRSITPNKNYSTSSFQIIRSNSQIVRDVKNCKVNILSIAFFWILGLNIGYRNQEQKLLIFPVVYNSLLIISSVSSSPMQSWMSALKIGISAAIVFQSFYPANWEVSGFRKEGLSYMQFIIFSISGVKSCSFRRISSRSPGLKVISIGPKLLTKACTASAMAWSFFRGNR
jgi:hypothetical protein